MVHEAIRKAVGDDWLVGIRFVVDEGHEEGSPDNIDFEECVRIARLFEREGHIDFFNCIFGRMDTDLSLAEHNMPGMSQPLAPFLKPVGAFKRETKLPVFHAARIPDIATARHAIAEGLLDMVAMTRAHMADPQIVNKLDARRGGAHPPLRRRLALHVEEGRLHPQSGDRARGRAAADRRARRRRPAAGSSSSAAGRAGSRRRASPPSAGTRSCCSRRRAGSAVSCCSRPRRRGARI